jgi:hypothetical protein
LVSSPIGRGVIVPPGIANAYTRAWQLRSRRPGGGGSTSLVNAGDDRFAGKALGPRNVGIMVGFSMLFRLVYLVAKRWRHSVVGSHSTLPRTRRALVRGVADSVNDLAYGLAGMVVYTVVVRRIALATRRRAKPDKR